jgi:type II secretory pathway pseudopilin PulG
MGKSLVVIVLISVLAVSLILNIALYYQNYSVTREKEDFTAYYNEFGNASLQSISYNFLPLFLCIALLKLPWIAITGTQLLSKT